MTTDATAITTEAGTRRMFNRKQLLVACAIATGLVLSGTTAGVLTVQHFQAVAAAERQVEIAAQEAAAAESASLSLFRQAIDASAAEATVLIADAAALSESGSSLITADDVAELAAMSAPLEDAIQITLPADATSADARAAFRELDASVIAARAGYAVVAARIAAAAQVAYDSYTLADPAVLTALVDGKAAFEAAAANKVPSADAFAVLTAAVGAAATSHQAAVDLAAAAAEAAASGKKTYTHNGQTYYSGTTTPAVPGTTSPPAPGTPSTPGTPALDAGAKAAALAAKYGGSTSVAGACLALNYGYVTPNASFGPSATYDGYYSAVSVSISSNPSYPNYYYVQWYTCPN